VPLDPSTWPTGRLLSSAARRIEREFNAHLDAWDLNHSSLFVLVHLSVRDHSQRELASASGVTEQTMSRILVRVERLGYVTRKPHPHDRRRHVIALSEAGARVVQEAADRERSEAMVGRGLTAQDLRELRRLLGAVIAAHPDPADEGAPDLSRTGRAGSGPAEAV
jgi:DNA-binding MarR family transcriptional regulator